MDETTRRNRKITSVGLILILALGLAWDIPMAHNAGKGDTISEVMRDVAHSWWTLPFMFMGVAGHLFWGVPGTKREMQFGKLAWACVVVGIRDLINSFYQLPTFFFAPAVVAVVGFVLGHLWWPQLGPQPVDGEPGSSG